MPVKSVAGADTAREISYAHSARTRAGRAFIRGMENATGRLKLIRMAMGYDLEVAKGRDFWEVMQERYRVTLDVPDGQIENIPTAGACVVVANHPFGILDGLAMGRILSMRRRDFKIMAHKVFHKAQDLADVILPINFDETRAAQEENLRTRRDCIAHLAAGGCIGVFPSGGVATSSKLWNRAMDPAWKTFTAKMIQRAKPAVIPVFFHGQNSRLFQIASHVNPTLRTALFINEFGRNVGGSVRAAIGPALPQEELDRFRGDARGLMDHLRIATYRLSPEPISDLGYGFDFG
ncbi:MAG: acyltransferase [Rhodobacteraceae bacterium]|nr:MAG: acyltransferase [Paracoccaceae bacterium]